jgi:hypothetical protein
MARRGFSAALALTIASALASCGFVGGETFRVEHPRAQGPLPVELADRTGMLMSLEAGEQVSGGRPKFGIFRGEGILSTVEVWWVGRACDDRVAVTLDQARERFRLEVMVESPRACAGAAVSRSIVLTFADQVTAEDFDVIVPTSVGRPPE